MKHVAGSFIALTLLAVPALANERMEAVSEPEPAVDVMYTSAAVPTLLTVNPYALPNVQLLSANRDDVMQTIGNMREQLADFGSLALDNGISQTADAFADNLSAAVQSTAVAEKDFIQAVMAGFDGQNSILINDFQMTHWISTEESLFPQPSVPDLTFVTPQGGFFAE